VVGLVGQRVFGIALWYENLIDHDQLRHDPVMAVAGGQAGELRTAGRRIDAQSAGIEPAGAGPLSQNQV
jgi:hypothetical protein